MRLTIEVQGLKALQRLLSPPENLYAEPWAKGMRSLGSQAGLAAQRGAPVRTGMLQGRIRTAVQNRPFPTWIAIRNQARRKGYPYPRLLAFSPKHGHRDWLINAVGPVFRNAGSALGRIGDEIARRWAGR